jgi:hypothetical protein
MNAWVIEILKGEKIKFRQYLNSFTTTSSNFFNIYLSLILKLSHIGKKTPNSQDPILLEQCVRWTK